MFSACVQQKFDAMIMRIAHGIGVIINLALKTANAMAFVTEDAVLAQKLALPQYLISGAAMVSTAIQIYIVNLTIV